MDIDTSLLREKFVINEKNADSKATPLSLICPSTRMPITLQTGEEFVIRTNNMHSCVRMAALMIDDYKETDANNLEELWTKSLSPYELKYNAEAWIAIYRKGNIVFSSGKHHQLFDIIEKCDAINDTHYDDSIRLAEGYFTKAGKEINMEYDSNVALVAVLNSPNGRCSIALRGVSKATTFNYSLKPLNKGDNPDISKGLYIAANFLEAVQLSYMVGVNNAKLKHGVIKKYSEEYKQAMHALDRIDMLDKKINQVKSIYSVHYRPERPNFKRIISLSEESTGNISL